MCRGCCDLQHPLMDGSICKPVFETVEAKHNANQANNHKYSGHNVIPPSFPLKSVFTFLFAPANIIV